MDNAGSFSRIGKRCEDAPALLKSAFGRTRPVASFAKRERASQPFAPALLHCIISRSYRGHFDMIDSTSPLLGARFACTFW